MTFTTKRRIHKEYLEILQARRTAGTVRELAERYGVTRQRVHQIVSEVEKRERGENKNEGQETE